MVFVGNSRPTLDLYCPNTHSYLPTGSWVQDVIDDEPHIVKVGLHLSSTDGRATIRSAQPLKERPDLNMDVAQLTTDEDSLVIAQNSPVEVVLGNILHDVRAGAVLEFAFVPQHTVSDRQSALLHCRSVECLPITF